MYKLVISSKAKKELKQLKLQYKEAIAGALEEIKEDPFVGKLLLRELTGRFSFRVGFFRIIYKVSQQDEIIKIITAGHRANVY